MFFEKSDRLLNIAEGLKSLLRSTASPLHYRSREEGKNVLQIFFEQFNYVRYVCIVYESGRTGDRKAYMFHALSLSSA